jgi:hypothetical protein
LTVLDVAVVDEAGVVDGVEVETGHAGEGSAG